MIIHDQRTCKHCIDCTLYRDPSTILETIHWPGNFQPSKRLYTDQKTFNPPGNYTLTRELSTIQETTCIFTEPSNISETIQYTDQRTVNHPGNCTLTRETLPSRRLLFTDQSTFCHPGDYTHYPETVKHHGQRQHNCSKYIFLNLLSKTFWHYSWCSYMSFSHFRVL